MVWGVSVLLYVKLMQTFPSIQQLAADRKACVAVTVGIAGNRHLPIADYLKIIRTAKARPDAIFPRSFTGWWQVSGHEILRQFRDGIHDRINLRGGIDVSEPSPHLPARILRNLRRTLVSTCRWCGSGLGEYRHRNSRFCCDSCRRDYHF